MSVALKYIPHYTYEDYCHWEGRWELIDGIPYAMAPSPVFQHQNMAGKIFNQLTEQLMPCKSCQAIISPFDWKISKDIVVEPDVMVICETIKGDFLTFPPTIIFEILSSSTEQKDKTIKYEIYQQQGVKYYIIVDGGKKIAEVFELQNKKYNRIAEAKKQTRQFNIKNCTVDFDFGKIW